MWKYWEQIDDDNVQCNVCRMGISISGNIVTNERSCLKPSNVDMLVFLNKNLS